ncbi:hypothetical protein RvY_04436 [Ramazzottius varieornatus]|uniref:G-protein coupled receptors family 1 profile domain-containing protein n=1 Tax=Ramazzottius varieornatus TaxID=947166 RepID=A0A1D1V0V8_RAMVA|nr:hypothetical protein RvY_04436 [Ramazzottius varieornatus]
MTANYNPSVNHTQNFSIPLTNTHELHAAFAVSTIVGLFGVLANLLLLIVIIRLVRHNPDSGSHVLIANLVLIYLLSCCPVLPMVSIPFALSISMPDAYCRYHSLFTYIVYWSANWTEACLGFNRVVAIYFPHKYSKYCNITVNCVLVALTWLLSLVMTTLVAFFGGATRTVVFGQCEFNVKSRAGGVIIALNTFVPWALIALASIAVIWRALQVYLARKVEATGNPRSNAQYNSYRRRLQVAKMLLLSFIWGTLCKMPFFVTGAVNKMLFITVPLLNSWFKVIVIAEYAVNPKSEARLTCEKSQGIGRSQDVWLRRRKIGRKVKPATSGWIITVKVRGIHRKGKVLLCDVTGTGLGDVHVAAPGMQRQETALVKSVVPLKYAIDMMEEVRKLESAGDNEFRVRKQPTLNALVEQSREYIETCWWH